LNISGFLQWWPRRGRADRTCHRRAALQGAQGWRYIPLPIPKSPNVKIRVFPALAALLLLVLGALLAVEWRWRATHALVQPPAASGDGAWVAEVRDVPEAQVLASGAHGVFVGRPGMQLRSLKPGLVFVAACDAITPRWFTPRRLVIECDLRAGEPVLLRNFVEDVVIELAVNRSFASAGGDRGRRANHRPAG
jgi:hypothetical protein